MTQQQPQLLDALIPQGQYRTPTALQAKGVTMPGIEGPARILLSLEGGYELEIPAIQETIDRLYDLLRSMTTRQ